MRMSALMATMHDPITLLAALAEPTRLAALRLLRDGQEHCVCELMALLGASQSRMSRHMVSLRQAGLVVDRRDAQWVRYRLNPAMPREVRRLVEVALDLPSRRESLAA
jgi:ArsR family transcriptional regulator